jgi:TRAP-type C4-dicarboxylate transport system permease small subunit
VDLEEATGAEETPQGVFGSLLRLLALIGGWIIVGLMVYTVADVILRYIFNRPFSGSIEVTEFAMAAIVAGSAATSPSTSWSGRSKTRGCVSCR